MRMFVLLLLITASCQPSGNQGVEKDVPLLLVRNSKSQPKAHHTVMIIDQGFDYEHPVFKNKIIAKYKIECSIQNDSIRNSHLDFRLMSGKLLARGVAGFSACELKPVSVFLPNSEFSEIMNWKSWWNTSIEEKSEELQSLSHSSIYQRVTGRDTGRSSANPFHGTAVASLYAYDNPNTKFILIESPVETDAWTCPRPMDIYQLDRMIQQFRDPNFRRNLSNLGVDKFAKQVADIVTRYGVTIINQSFGERPYLDKLNRLEMSGCVMSPKIKSQFLRKHRELDHLTKQVSRLIDDPFTQIKDEVLFIQAAGNERLPIHSRQHSATCFRDENHLLVGSVDHNGRLSSFSNYGECVDFYMLGEDVIHAAPKGFNSFGSGTSFSTPLLGRLVTLNTDPNGTPADWVEYLRESADDQLRIKKDLQPLELSIKNGTPVKFE